METRSLGRWRRGSRIWWLCCRTWRFEMVGHPCGDMIGMLVVSENHSCQKAEGVETSESKDMVKGKVATEVWT